MTGPTYADTTVVEARSYSRISGHVSWEATTTIPGRRSRHIVATRCS